MSSPHHDAASYVAALLTREPQQGDDELTAIWEQIIRTCDWDTLVIILGALVGIAQDQLEHNHPDPIARLEHIADCVDVIRSNAT